jgi:NAD(P)-dependent dehydrogenase (short-subunit alcohol dehydrogenase family)
MVRESYMKEKTVVVTGGTSGRRRAVADATHARAGGRDAVPCLRLLARLRGYRRYRPCELCLASKNLPHDWKEQRCFLGFA